MNFIKWVAVVLLANAGCASSKQAKPVIKGSEELYAHRWNLAELHGKAVPPADSERQPHLLFTPGQVGRVAGSTGCNRLNGTFDLAGMKQITFSPVATTRMACPNATAESEFLAALTQADNYLLVDNFLLLNKGRRLLARFVTASQ